MKRILILSSLCLTLLITGCTTIAPKATDSGQLSATPIKVASWKERQSLLERLQSWQLSGKIAVKTPKDAGSANISWAQTGSRYNISLTGPFGASGMRLAGVPGKVTLTTAEGKQLTASSPEQLLLRQWGYHLPISNLKYWVRGLPAKDTTFEGQFDQQNRLVHLMQAGWTIQFSNYVSKGLIDLPEKIFIYSPSLNVRMIIYNWQT